MLASSTTAILYLWPHPSGGESVVNLLHSSFRVGGILFAPLMLALALHFAFTNKKSLGLTQQWPHACPCSEPLFPALLALLTEDPLSLNASMSSILASSLHPWNQVSLYHRIPNRPPRHTSYRVADQLVTQHCYRYW